MTNPIAGYQPLPFRFGGLGVAPTVAHSDIVTSSLSGPGTAATAARSDILPIGTPLPWLTGTPPAGYLMMDGSAVSRTTYAALFALLGTTYGIGDGSTTFNLPAPAGRTFIGSGTGSGLTARTLAGTGGEEAHTLQISEMPSHQHTYPASIGAGGGGGNISETSPFGSTSTNLAFTGGGGSHNNMQPWLAINWIIRAL